MYTKYWPIRDLLPGLMAALALNTGLVQAAQPGANATAAPAAGQRPRVGLVLAGGGAKGAAHVGVLKVLEEMHVPIDCIAGTSMGALVGAGYASGISSADMTTFLLGIDWKTVVGGLGQRGMEPIEQKRQGVTYSNSLDLGFQDSHVVMSSGLVNTSGIENLLRGFVSKARSQTDFDRFSIPFRAVATDMVTGKMVVMDHGDLATAMRASMAIPGAFAPVVTEGMVLADGGLVRNIPVDVARNLCADVVIVVNLVEPAAKAENMRSPAQLLGRTMDVMIEANETLQLQSITSQDVRIDVEMGDLGTADFERVGEAIPLGEAAARKMAPQLARFAVPADQYAAWRNRVTTGPNVEFQVASVQFRDLKRVNPDYRSTAAMS
jgi:NTE family protein